MCNTTQLDKPKQGKEHLHTGKYNLGDILLELLFLLTCRMILLGTVCTKFARLTNYTGLMDKGLGLTIIPHGNMSL